MGLTIGVCRLTLRFPENGSLKGKRMVLNSVRQRLHNRFNVSFAEVEHNDTWQLAGVAIAVASNSAAHANEVLSKAVNYLESLRLDVELVDEEIELIDA